MKNNRCMLLCVFFVFLLVLPGNRMSQDYCMRTPRADSLFCESAQKYYIKKVIDLQGGEVKIAPDCELVFIGRGKIKNGVLVGNNTKIKGTKKLFDRVTIKGSWNVPDISTEMFASLDYTNSLRDVIALSDSIVHNKITIKQGDYVVSTDEKELAGVIIKSNTDLVIEGTIKLKPNGQKRSYVILVEHSANVNISGTGNIIGDKEEHLGSEGEWGMGIYVARSKNVSISNVSIYNCWGDCICVCKDSEKVLIQNCLLSGGRRQGISIIAVRDIVVKNCAIKNVGGTNPEYAIDVEPNSGEFVQNVLIDNVIVDDCKGGFLVYAKAQNALVENVVFRNCQLRATNKYPLRCEGGDSIKVVSCDIDAANVSYCVFAEGVNGFVLERNRIRANKRVFRKLSNAVVKDNDISCKYLFSAYNETYTNIEFIDNRIDGRVEGGLENSRFERNRMIGKESIMSISSKSNTIRENTFE